MAPILTPQPLIAVHDVEATSAWYQRALGLTSGHGGDEYEQLLSNGELVLQLHRLEEDHHHESVGNPTVPLGNGVALWFATDDIESAADRVRAVDPIILTDLHLNPNSHKREIWVRDPNNYLVVLTEI